MASPRAFADWCLRNRQTGEITVSQPPNASAVMFGGTWALRRVLRSTTQLDTTLEIVQTGALFVWAGDELARGVNPWRRSLGAGAFVLWAWSKWRTAA